jgi:predicted aspartyl protease
MRFTKLALFAIALIGFSTAAADDFDHHIPLDQTSAATFYIAGNINGYGDVSLLVDTGSTYTAIDEDTLKRLQAGGNATYLRVLNGVMADGSKLKVKVYKISGLTLGNGCMIRDVEAAVFPKKTRPILGLSALQKVSPFIFSMDPPALALSNCEKQIATTEEGADDLVSTDAAEDYATQVEAASAPAK